MNNIDDDPRLLWDVQSWDDDRNYWSSWYGGAFGDKEKAVHAYNLVTKHKDRVAKNVRLVEITTSVIRDDRNYKYGTNGRKIDE